MNYGEKNIFKASATIDDSYLFFATQLEYDRDKAIVLYSQGIHIFKFLHLIFSKQAISPATQLHYECLEKYTNLSKAKTNSHKANVPKV